MHTGKAPDKADGRKPQPRYGRDAQRQHSRGGGRGLGGVPGDGVGQGAENAAQKRRGGQHRKAGAEIPEQRQQQPYPAQKEKYAGAFCHGKAKGKGEYGHGNACHGEKRVLYIQFFAHFFSTPDLFSSLAILMPISAPSADTATTAKVIPTAASGALSATAASGLSVPFTSRL